MAGVYFVCFANIFLSVIVYNMNRKLEIFYIVRDYINSNRHFTAGGDFLFYKGKVNV